MSRGCRSTRRSTDRVSSSPRAPSVAWLMVAVSLTGASSTSHTPSGKSDSQRRAASVANRVFPAPPGPTMVASRPPSSHVRHPLHLVIAADEAGQERAQVAVPQPFCRRVIRDRRLGRHVHTIRCRHRGNRWAAGYLAAERRDVDRPQVGSRIDTELVGKVAAQLLIGGQRLGRAAVGSQGSHQLTGEPLPQRMRGEEFFQLGDHVGRVTEPEIRLDPVGPPLQPLLVQTGRPGHRVRHTPRVRQRFSPPQRQRLDQGVPGALHGTVRQLPMTGADQIREGDGVDVAPVHGEPIAARDLRDGGRLQQGAPQPGDQGLQPVDRVTRGALRPHRIDQLGDGDRPGSVGCQPGQQAPQPRPGDCDDPPAGAHLQRTEDPDLHWSTVPDVTDAMSRVSATPQQTCSPAMRWARARTLGVPVSITPVRWAQRARRVG